MGPSMGLFTLIFGVRKVEQKSNSWAVVNRNHKEYGLASTQYVHTIGETRAIVMAYNGGE